MRQSGDIANAVRGTNPHRKETGERDRKHFHRIANAEEWNREGNHGRRRQRPQPFDERLAELKERAIESDQLSLYERRRHIGERYFGETHARGIDAVPLQPLVIIDSSPIACPVCDEIHAQRKTEIDPKGAGETTSGVSLNCSSRAEIVKQSSGSDYMLTPTM